MSRRGNSWSTSSHFSFCCGFYKEPGKWMTDDEKTEIPSEVVEEIKSLFPADNYDELCFEIVIPFTSEGYYDPGSMYGGPDNLGSPPEGDDERLLDGVATVDLDGVTKELSKKASQILFSVFEDDIYDEEIDKSPPEPDYDAIEERRRGW